MKPMFFAFTMCLVRLVFSQINPDQELNKRIILNQMIEWGNKTFSSGCFTTAAVKKQYLVAAVVTDSMLKDPKLLQLTRGCPITRYQEKEQEFWNTSMICATSAVVFNRVDEKISQRSNYANKDAYKDHSWHGEYMFLKARIFETLTDRFKAIGFNEPCQTFLYSYFIPCNYNSKIQPYKCSDLLSGYDGTNDKCPITVIGYTSVHAATAINKKPTKDALQQKFDLVHLVENKTNKTDESAFEISKQLIQYVKKETTPFQDVFYDCLSNSPIEFCCIDVTRNNDKKVQVLALYVNHVTKKFVSTSRFRNFGGAISSNRLNRAKAESAFRSLATEALSTDCNRCLIEHLKLYVRYCIKKTFDMTDYFGTPSYNPAHPGWIKYEDLWQNMYVRVNWETRNIAQCMFNDLIPESLCTSKPSASNMSKRPKLDRGD